MNINHSKSKLEVRGKKETNIFSHVNQEVIQLTSIVRCWSMPLLCIKRKICSLNSPT